jgi:hypothetical protein
MKPPRAKVPATPASHKLLKKLEALAAAPGTPDEGKAAAKKLARLKAKYDFTLPDASKEGLFAGRFAPGIHGRPVMDFPDSTLSFWTKWALEDATGISCTFQGSQLLANATPETAEKLKGIAKTITEGFSGLWSQFQSFPGIIAAQDKEIFMRGLYDGLMNEIKPLGERLPSPAPVKVKKAKKKALAHPAGIGLHPYAVALDLGKQIRFCVPLSDISNQLENLKPKEIAA